jgi:HlyD family secretion protein
MMRTVLTAGPVALAAALMLTGCSKPAPKSAAPQPLTVTVAPVELRRLSDGLTVSGLLVSREEAGVSSELAGYRVAQVLADEDAWVKKGQPLARLDDTLLKAQIAQQQANVAQQEVAADRAKAEADRVKGLDNQGVLSNEQIAERRLAVRSAEAAVAVARAGLNDLKTRDARMVIRAPVSGRVLERTARPGDTSSPGTTLYRIARDGLIELDAEVDEADLSRVSVGNRVRVILPSGASMQGAVRFISPRVDSQTKLGHVRIALPVRPDLRPGGFARAVFEGAGKPTEVVPESAVHFDASGGYVMVVDANNRVHPTPVKTGQRSQGLVELTEGPPVGSRVALGGGVFLLDGDRVQPVQVATAPKAAAPVVSRQ